MEFVTHSPSETQILGEKLAQRLQPGDVLALSGELGTGKTCFIQGVARGLGVKEKYISSPSFVMVKEYEGHIPFCHIDLYRISHPNEIIELGLEEFLRGERVCAIEWAEKAGAFLPPETIKINFEFLNETKRKIIIQGLDEKRINKMTKLKFFNEKF